MPYIGNDLATQFQAFATQTITGDGSTGYTLDRAVANGKELLVYINNVKQEEGSGKSYEASGTTITFSEAVASGDSCYLVYMGSAQQTVTAPDGSIVSGQIANANLEMPNTLDMNGKELILDADGDTSITADTDDQIDIKIGGSDVGVIGSTSSRLHIVNGDTGLRIAGDIDQVFPCGTSGADRDNAIDLGSSGVRFKDLYLGGGLYVGGTGSANKLDDYEEGTFTATMANSVTLTSNYDSLAYTKIGRQVTVTGQIQINNDNSNSHVVINNLPFTHFTQSSPNEDADRAFCAVRLYNHDMADDAQYVGAFTAENTTNLYFVNVRDNAANADLEADASGYLMFTITYFST